MHKYFVLREGSEPDGPFPETEIRRQLQVGELSFTDHICQDGWKKWEPVLRIFPPAENKPTTISPPLIKQSEKLKPLAHPKDTVCLACGYIGRPVTLTQGSFVIEVLLYLLFCAPGLIYSVWRLTSRRKVCCGCQSTNIIPCTSPRASELCQIEY